MYPCDTKISESGEFAGFKRVKNATCSFCQPICKPPIINDDIPFFQGFKGTQVFITYAVMLAFTIAWQIYVRTIRASKVDAEWNKMQDQTNQQKEHR